MRWAIALPLVGLFLVPTGCGPKKAEVKAPTIEPTAKAADKSSPTKAADKKEPPKAEPFKKPPAGTITRRFEAGDMQQVLKQIHLAYKNFELSNNRAPGSREELEDLYEKNAKINEYIKDGYIVVLWKAMKTDDPDNTVLAYEAEPDRMGNRVVLTVSGDPSLIPDAVFQKMAKVKQRK